MSSLSTWDSSSPFLPYTHLLNKWVTVAYSRCFWVKQLIDSLFFGKVGSFILFHASWISLAFWVSSLSLSHNFCVWIFCVSLLSLNINLTLTETVSLSQMEESHSLILLKAARSKSAHNITWKVHIFCSAAHRNVLIACSFSLEIIVIRKNFNENDIYTLTHIPLRFFKWMIRLNAAKWSKKMSKISLSTHLSSSLYFPSFWLIP